MAHFKASADHEDKLLEDVAMAYVSCIGDIIRPMIEMGIEATISILTEAKNSYGPLASPSQITRLKMISIIPQLV